MSDKNGACGDATNGREEEEAGEEEKMWKKTHESEEGKRTGSTTDRGVEHLEEDREECPGDVNVAVAANKQHVRQQQKAVAQRRQQDPVRQQFKQDFQKEHQKEHQKYQKEYQKKYERKDANAKVTCKDCNKEIAKSQRARHEKSCTGLASFVVK